MTNRQIMAMETSRLMAEGILKGTGKIIKFEVNGEIFQYEECEEIHTFQGWKERGYNVKKGEKSTIKFPIWSYHKGKKIVSDDATEEQSGGKCFMKTACFFKGNQVEKIEKK